MSKTNKTNESRIARRLNRLCLAASNRGDHDLANELSVKLKEMGAGIGIRYGNHRKWKAAEKVQERRRERHNANKEQGE